MGAGSCPPHSTGVHSVLGNGDRGTGDYSTLTLSSRQSLLGGYIPVTRFPQNWKSKGSHLNISSKIYYFSEKKKSH